MQPKIAAPTSSQTQSTIDDLLDYERETGRPLPMPAKAIAAIESFGLVVDLETGEIALADDFFERLLARLRQAGPAQESATL